MLIIDCPHCGPRPQQEFAYGGQAQVSYAADPEALTDQQWADYLFYRDNPDGSFAERWVHSAGCRKWFDTHRDTTTYRFITPQPTTQPTTKSTSKEAHA